MYNYLVSGETRRHNVCQLVKLTLWKSYATSRNAVGRASVSVVFLNIKT